MITRELLHRSLANDFALLFTDIEFDLSEHIDTVCLPQVALIMSLMMMDIILDIIAMNIILVSNVAAWRTIPLLHLLCHWLGKRSVWD